MSRVRLGSLVPKTQLFFKIARVNRLHVPVFPIGDVKEKKRKKRGKIIQHTHKIRESAGRNSKIRRRILLPDLSQRAPIPTDNGELWLEADLEPRRADDDVGVVLLSLGRL